MKKVYLDNGSTSFPKARGVSAAMCEYIEEIGANVSRGGYQSAFTAAERIFETRQKLCTLFAAPSPKNIIFTAGATLSLNMLLYGLLHNGDHVLTSSMEHNAVMRPLFALSQKGVSYDKIPCDQQGRLLTDTIESMILPSTRAIVMTHASNVCGTLMPIEQTAQICQKHNLFFIVDAAQSAGVFPISMKETGIDALVFPGHKGLLGPSGIGGFAISSRLAQALDPVLCGGTGSRSDSIETPTFLPDKFEPGTANIPGIFGLCAALDYIEQTGIDNIRKHELALATLLMDGINGLNNVRLVGLNSIENRAAVLSLDFIGQDNAEVAFKLEQQFGIMTRCGLHCAPEAHKTLGTYPHGTVRFVPGHATTEDEIGYAVDCIRKLV